MVSVHEAVLHTARISNISGQEVRFPNSLHIPQHETYPDEYEEMIATLTMPAQPKNNGIGILEMTPFRLMGFLQFVTSI